MEILQNLESPKWKKILIIEIIVIAICCMALVFVSIHYEAQLSSWWYLPIYMVLAIVSFISSAKTIAKYLAVDDNNLIFKCMIGTTLLPLSEIATIEKADDQLYGRGKDKIFVPDKEAVRVYGTKDTTHAETDDETHHQGSQVFSKKNMAYAGWCKRGTEHKYFLFSAQRDNHALITTKDGKLYVVDYENAEAIKRKAGLN